jgi:apolipoprotein D and lipocalin family protein
MRARLGTLALFLTVAGGVPAAWAQTPAPPQTVASVDLDRYAGRWYEVARFPNRFQKQCTGDVVVEYARREDGRIDVVNRCRTAGGATDEARGIARRAGGDTSNAKLEVRFAPAVLSFLPVWGDYWIIALDADYRHAIVGDRKRNYLWFLSRTPSVPDAVMADLKAKAAAQGFDVTRLQPTANTLAQ